MKRLKVFQGWVLGFLRGELRPTLADRRLLSRSWCNKVLRDAREGKTNSPEWIACVEKPGEQQL